MEKENKAQEQKQALDAALFNVSQLANIHGLIYENEVDQINAILSQAVKRWQRDKGGN